MSDWETEKRNFESRKRYLEMWSKKKDAEGAISPAGVGDAKCRLASSAQSDAYDLELDAIRFRSSLIADRDKEAQEAVAPKNVTELRVVGGTEMRAQIVLRHRGGRPPAAEREALYEAFLSRITDFGKPGDSDAPDDWQSKADVRRFLQAKSARAKKPLKDATANDYVRLFYKRAGLET